MKRHKRTHNSGFTLVELLVVIAIVAILAAVALVALDPATRFADARDSQRANDVNELLSALKLDQVDNGGAYHANVSGLTADEFYMIGTGMAAGCDDNDANCEDGDVTSDTHCVDVSFLVTEGYIDAVPINPTASTNATPVTWDDGSGAGEEGTGYIIEREGAGGIVHVTSCHSENTTAISASR